MPIKLFGHSIQWYLAAAALLQAAAEMCFGRHVAWKLFYYAVLYGCQILCIYKAQDLSSLSGNVLSAAWVLTVVLQLFFTCSSYGVILPGDFGLQFHIPPLISCIYPVGFFIIACHRFAAKFQESDDLNEHLEMIVEEKTREQSRFIRSMLHNLKTPLFSLVGYSDMAAASLEHTEQAKLYLSKVSDKAQYVSRLIDRLFLLTQMDANQTVFQKVPVQLEKVLESIAEATRLKGREKNIRVELTAEPDAFCMGDPLYLQQAFQNIADNAAEHINQNGILILSLHGSKEEWVLTFSDDGCGISAEDLPHIFDRYYSNHHGRRSSSGLGLTIAKEIVSHHGGTITVTSRPEKGTTFTIRLPRPEEASEISNV